MLLLFSSDRYSLKTLVAKDTERERWGNRREMHRASIKTLQVGKTEQNEARNTISLVYVWFRILSLQLQLKTLVRDSALAL